MTNVNILCADYIGAIVGGYNQFDYLQSMEIQFLVISIFLFLQSMNFSNFERDGSTPSIPI